jgi:N-acetylneuraminate synthase/N,N'-diacetyllegionaminate synthase
LPFEGFRRLAEVAKSEKVIFFSTPLSLSDIDNLDEIQPIFKISSGDLTFLELIRYAAGKGKPMIISTGLGTEDEISAAVEVVLKVRPTAREDGSLMLMHCICAYPTPAEEANLRSIDYLRDRFGLPVGYSDHTIGIKASELAVASGAVTIEKHFTYRKEDQIFHDHKLSANPDDMRDLVESIRLAEKYLGRKHRIRSKSEESMLLHMRRSIGTVVDIPAGVAVRREWLTWLRPAWGIGPDDMGLVEGKRLNKPLKAGAIVRAEDVEA